MKNTKCLFYPFVVIVAAIVFFITAYNSHGYYHPDEHYQIVEFAQFKLGIINPETLAWEYRHQIRPTLQPMVCYTVFKVLHALNIENPYHQALCLRLLTAIFALIAIHFFVQQTKHLFKNQVIQKGYILLSYFLWFIPFLSVRFASETWSGLLFLLGLTLVLKNSNKKTTFLSIGILLGCSFLFRFQIAFAIFGLFLWFFFINKTKINALIVIGIGFLFVVVLGICLDSWFYGNFVFAPWNYFYSNIVNDKASSFGVSPWYFYFTKIISFPNYIVGICVALSMVILLIKRPKNIFLWCFIPFLLAHSIIPHKEERFIFPLAYLFAVMLTTAYGFLHDFIQKRTLTKVLNYVFLIIFAVVNITGLLVMSQNGPEKGKIVMTKYVYDNYKDRPINLLFFNNSNPYNPWHLRPIRFYSPDNLQNQIYISNLEELNNYLPVEGYETLLFIKKSDWQNTDITSTLKERGYIFKQQSVPVWVEKMYRCHDNFPEMWIYTLYVYED